MRGGAESIATAAAVVMLDVRLEEGSGVLQLLQTFCFWCADLPPPPPPPPRVVQLPSGAATAATPATAATAATAATSAGGQSCSHLAGATPQLTLADVGATLRITAGRQLLACWQLVACLVVTRCTAAASGRRCSAEGCLLSLHASLDPCAFTGNMAGAAVCGLEAALEQPSLRGRVTLSEGRVTPVSVGATSEVAASGS